MIEQLNEIITDLNTVIAKINKLEGAEGVKAFGTNKIREAIMSVNNEVELQTPKDPNSI